MRALFLLGTVVAASWVASCLPGNPRCDSDEDCSGNFQCVFDKAENATVCASQCAADSPCEDGFACVAVDGELEGVCLDVRDDRGVGQKCTEDRECGSGACAGAAGDQECVETCTFEDGCGDGLRCVLDGLRNVCATPTDDREIGAACDSSLECLSGMCVVSPASDQAACVAPCGEDEDCGGDVCVRLELGARACLESLPDGAACIAHDLCAGGFCVEDRDGVAKCASPCDAGACAPDFFCVDDEEGNDVCMPRLDDRAAGEACEINRECDSGLCRHFVADTDLGTLCADPCAATEPVCGEGLVCWDGDEVDVCGPTPP
jgi:hypothetical protein